MTRWLTYLISSFTIGLGIHALLATAQQIFANAVGGLQ